MPLRCCRPPRTLKNAQTYAKVLENAFHVASIWWLPEYHKIIRNMQKYRRLGVKTGAKRRPPPGIQAQHPAPAPHASHARHDRSMARNRLAARAKVGGLDSSPRGSRKNVPRQFRTCCFISFILARNYNGFLVDMIRPQASPLIKIRVS